MTTEMSHAVLDLLPDGLSPRLDSLQERKSSKTRTTILEAALDVLTEHGYARTTHNLICQRAQVSRGAMLHHYPTTQDLMVAVIDYAFYKHMRDFSERVSALTDEERKDRNSAIAIDWQLCNSREMLVYLELRTASRTDADLRSIFLPRARHHDLVWKEELLKVFPEWRDDMRKLDLSRRLARAILEGLTMSRELWRDADSEWAVLAFSADVIRRIRVGELRFPDAEEVNRLKEVVTAAGKRTRRTTPASSPAGRRKSAA